MMSLSAHRQEAASPSLDRRILTIAGPAIGGYLGMILFDVANMFWVSRLGGTTIAAVASSGFLVWTMASLMQITLSGCTSLVAQAHGARRPDDARQVVTVAARLSLVLSLGFMGLWALLGQRPFAWMGLTPEVMTEAGQYFSLLVVGFPVTYLYNLAGSVFNAYGETRQTTWSLSLALVVNMVLDPLLIFGYGGLPALGIRGAALATVISHLIGLGLRVRWLRQAGYIGPLSSFIGLSGQSMQDSVVRPANGESPSSFSGAPQASTRGTPGALAPRAGDVGVREGNGETPREPLWPSPARSIVAVGLPNALIQGVWSMVYPVLTTLISPFGMAPLAAIGICFRLESFPYFGCMGLGVAMSAIVGQAVGSNDLGLISRVTRRGQLFATLLVFPFSLLFILAPGLLLGWFADDRLIVGHAARYLFAIGVFEIFMGWELLFAGVFTGLGKTHPMLFVSLPFTVARIPLAWFLAYRWGWGIEGIWWAIGLSTLGKGLGLALLFRREQAHLQPAATRSDTHGKVPGA